VNRTVGSLQRYTVASTSQIQWCSRRNATFGNPLNWIREKLTPTTREKSSEEEIIASQQAAEAEGNRNLFESAAEVSAKARMDADGNQRPTRVFTEHKYSTANFKISHRKLNMIGRQIAGKPIDYAILQMMFSEKRVSKRVKSMLVTARNHATHYKHLDHSKLVVAESWVTKGPKSLKRFEPRGRGHFGIRVHPDSRLNVVLKEGKTFEQKRDEDRAKKLKRIVSAGLVREDKPLRNMGPMWSW
jgi:large subunit ribosomal protein L22